MGRSALAIAIRHGLIVIAASFVTAAAASSAAASERAEAARLFGVDVARVEVGPEGGTPPASEVRVDGKPTGYVLSTHRVTGSLGYAGKRLDIRVGLSTDGTIAGARLVDHQEPILVIGISSEALERFVSGFEGMNVLEARSVHSWRQPAGSPDHVSGATVSSAVMKDSVLRAARAVAASRGLLPGTSPAGSIDRSSFETASFDDLAARGGVAVRRFDEGDLGPPSGPGDTRRQAFFVELATALLTPPTIGQNLLGRRAFEALMGRLDPRDNAILVAARGRYSFKGTAWRQDGRFDRIRLIQGTRTITFSQGDHELVERLAVADAPDFREIGLFRIAHQTGFEPTLPWRLELIVEREGSAPSILSLDYVLPARFIAPPSRSEPPEGLMPLQLWEEIWRERVGELVILGTMLFALATILFSHDLLVRNITLYRRVRLGFLAATLLFLGVYAGAQLSVVNVVTFTHALLAGFRWEQFLLDPLIFVLWSFVALSLLFWGRGVFCGWLCPFGALQELLNEGARRLGVRQITIPWPIHERLWPIKYVLFLVILGVSFQSATNAFVLAEVEPFKTTIAMKLARAWPYVAYVVALLAAGLFIERFYCRYLCPLGAGLAIPARLKIFDWLKRRPQCGRECRVCATRCTVQAINPTGQIVPNECIYCLQCQANYYDAATCLPLKQRAMRRGRAQGAQLPEIGEEAGDA